LALHKWLDYSHFSLLTFALVCYNLRKPATYALPR
jgi:hypothetical protein